MVWLTRQQIATLLGRDYKTISKHINNALKEELADEVRLLGTALGMHRWAEYVDGCTDFLVMQMGTKERIDWTLHDPYKTMLELHETIRNAARWWYEYGKETLLSKDVYI